MCILLSCQFPRVSHVTWEASYPLGKNYSDKRKTRECEINKEKNVLIHEKGLKTAVECRSRMQLEEGRY